MKKILKTCCILSAFILLVPAFSYGWIYDSTDPDIEPPAINTDPLDPDDPDGEIEYEPGCNPPGCIEDYAYALCHNPDGFLGDSRSYICPGGGSGQMSCLYEGGSTYGGIGGVPFWQIIGCNSNPDSCPVGYVYDLTAGKCRLRCDNGKFVDNKSECDEIAVVEQVCPPGIKGYQTCEKNGIDCGTQERTCSALGQWPASWGECKVL